MGDDEATAFVIDNGTHSIKAGFAGDDVPKTVFPTATARLRADPKTHLVGEEAVAAHRKGEADIVRPIERGVVTNWEEMEKVWERAFYAERIAPEDHPVLLTETAYNPKGNRERMTQVMFETFNIPALFVALQPVLSLYASGRTTGLVVDIGEGVSDCLPISEGYPLPFCGAACPVSGGGVTAYMQQLLKQKGCDVSLDAAREVKKRLGMVALDPTKAPPSDIEKSMELPDGTQITVGVERCYAGEALFRPSLVDPLKSSCQSGVSEAAYGCLLRCDAEMRREMCSAVVLSGGGSMLPGMQERLTQDLVQWLPSTAKLRVIAPPERKFCTWIGGSILSSLAPFQQLWISKQEYDESGPTIVNRKCF